MYGRILVPLDGSPLGERALLVALPIAQRHGARLTLLHVFEPPLPLVMGMGMPVRDSAYDLGFRKDREKYLKRVAQRTAKSTDVPVDTVMLDGRVVPTIADYAREKSVGLVVLSTHGRGGFGRFWLGGVADGLLRQLTVPTLLVRAGRAVTKLTHEQEVPLFPKVIVALDGSERAEVALDAALELVQGASADITIAHVVHPSATVEANRLPSRVEEEMLAGYLEPLAARHRNGAVTIDVETIVNLSVGRGILEVVEEHGAHLVAVATQGLGGFQRAVIGSVADKLIRTAPTPVLVVPVAESAETA